MVLLLSIGIPILYFLTGAVYVRANSVKLYAKAYTESKRFYMDAGSQFHLDNTRETYNIMRFVRFFFWPFGVMYDYVWPSIQNWIDMPVTEYNQETDMLRESMKFWQEQAADRSLDETNREIARSFAKGYLDMINERIRIR